MKLRSDVAARGLSRRALAAALATLAATPPSFSEGLLGAPKDSSLAPDQKSPSDAFRELTLGSALNNPVFEPGCKSCVNQELESSPLIDYLKKKTADNKEANDARVNRITNAAAASPYAGEPGMKRMVTNTDGGTIFLYDAQIAQLTREGRMRCDPRASVPCRIVEIDGYGPMGMDLQLPEVKELVCDDNGRNCKLTSPLLTSKCQGMDCAAPKSTAPKPPPGEPPAEAPAPAGE